MLLKRSGLFFYSHNAELYYAIWGYNEHVKLSSYIGTTESGKSTLPEKVSTSDGISLYAWYVDDGFATSSVSSLTLIDSTDTTKGYYYTYYARASFTLTLEFYGSAYALYQTEDLKGNTKQEVGDTNTSKYAYYTIYEGDTISVEITDSNTYVRVYINDTEEFKFYAKKRQQIVSWYETNTYRTFNDTSDHPVYVNGSDTAITIGQTSVYSGTVTADFSIKFWI